MVLISPPPPPQPTTHPETIKNSLPREWGCVREEGENFSTGWEPRLYLISGVLPAVLFLARPWPPSSPHPTHPTPHTSLTLSSHVAPTPTPHQYSFQYFIPKSLLNQFTFIILVFFLYFKSCFSPHIFLFTSKQKCSDIFTTKLQSSFNTENVGYP